MLQSCFTACQMILASTCLPHLHPHLRKLPSFIPKHSGRQLCSPLYHQHCIIIKHSRVASGTLVLVCLVCFFLPLPFLENHPYFLVCLFIYLFIYLLILVFLGPHPQDMESPRLGVKSELVYATTTAMPDLTCVCDLHHSSQQHWILNQLSEARD